MSEKKGKYTRREVMGHAARGAALVGLGGVAGLRSVCALHPTPHPRARHSQLRERFEQRSTRATRQHAVRGDYQHGQQVPHDDERSRIVEGVDPARRAQGVGRHAQGKADAHGKAVERGMTITDVRLEKKSGGASGTWER